ncbi:MAG: Ig-like domain-containing protein, partial [Bacteroidales bacterium]|nr:Ig-like domain-containing protein [Bacteroidales bacterium]
MPKITHFFILLALLLLSGCATKNDLAALEERLGKVENQSIATIHQQINSINGTLTSLGNMDTELRGLIETLQRQKDELVHADELLEQKITAAGQEAAAQLETYKRTVTGQISAINTTLEELTSKDTDLQQQISALRTYIDTDIKNLISGQISDTRTWVSTTFVTLEKYNQTAAIVAGIQGQLETLLGTMATQAQLESALGSLREDLQGEISQAVTDCNTAITTARQELTDAYEGAIRSAIETSEASLKNWVNEQLTGYYTIAQTEAKLSTLEGNLTNQLSSQKADLEGLIADNATSLDKHQASIDSLRKRIVKLEEDLAGLSGIRDELNTAKSEITEAYQGAIQAAIETLDGKLSGQMATEISTLNGRITTEVSQINATLDTLTQRVSQCETDLGLLRDEIAGIKADIAKLLARIQSLTYIPRYSDGQATVYFIREGEDVQPENVTLDFEVHPASAAADLAALWQEAVTLKAVSTITRSAPEFINLPITTLEADGGVITLQAETGNLPAVFFAGDTSASACLSISDGTNDRVSEYVPLLAIERSIRVTTLPAFDIMGTSAKLLGQIHHIEPIPGAEIGFYYSATSATAESLAANGTQVTCSLQSDDTFQTSVSGLPAGNIYYVAFARIGGKSYYGEVKGFSIRGGVEGTVDLGLSILWGSCNLGATKPEEYGYYYAWGETKPNSWFGGPWYKWGNGEEGGFTKYNTGAQWGTVIDNQTTFLPEDDAALFRMGLPWRMPTESEMKELVENCTWEWTQVNGVNGYAVSRSGSSIFLPAAGYREGPGGEYEVSESGMYLSSMIMPENPLNAFCIRFQERSNHLTYYFRTSGYTIRPVYDPDFTPVPVTGVSLEQRLHITVGKTFRLMPTVLPENASDKVVTWTSTAPSVATVDADGIVAGAGAGTAVITATTRDGGFSAACAVTVTEPLPVPDAIDLGLSVKWASFNLGGTKAEGLGYSGYYYAWGETLPKENYNWETYLLCNGTSHSLLKYCHDENYGIVDNLDTLLPIDDAATVELGAPWRIPTYSEYIELHNNCDVLWIDNTDNVNKRSGCMFT